MDRRDFSRLALAGFGIAAFPRGVAKAIAPAGSILPPPMASLSSTGKSFLGQIGLIDRAKAALDRHRAVIPLRDRVAIADFGVASSELRFHIVDLISGVSNSYLVAHGKGSDPDHSGWLQRFSNETGSLATS